MEHIVIKEATVRDGAATGKTRHYVGGKLVEDIAKLQIAYYPENPGFYLFYLIAGGEIVTDTFHDSIEGAQDQAFYEFSTLQVEWFEPSK